MLIRRATEWDAHHILECIHEAFAPYRDQYTPDGFHDTILDHGSVIARLRAMAVFVAVADDGDVIGTIACNRVNAEEAHIRGMAVRPQWQGRGVAEQLLDAAEKYAHSIGCIRVTLGTTEVLKRAIHFYEKHGYRPTVVEDFFGMPLHDFAKTITSD